MLAVRVVLLGRSEALFENYGQRFAVGVGILSRAEVDKLDLVVLCDENVIGRNVAVDKPELVHLHERIEYGAHDGEYLVDCDLAAAAVQILFERHAVEKLHNDIRRAVCGKEIAHIDHAGQVLYLGERARFFDEPPKSAVTRALVLLGIDNYLVVARDARYVAGGEVFLDGDLDALLKVPSEVGYTEAAFAERLAHEIAVLRAEHGALRQMVGRGGGVVRLVVAGQAHS